MKKRTDLDFSKHKLTIIEHEGISIHRFLVPGTYYDSFIFINTQGIMTVTGDYGNWVFCREFHPSANGKVSDYYWCEKLELDSEQKAFEWDDEAAKKEIENELNSLREGYCENLEETLEYYERLLNHTEWETGYKYNAHFDKPDGIETEYIPFPQKINNQLLCVFDAFEEICERLKNN